MLIFSLQQTRITAAKCVMKRLDVNVTFIWESSQQHWRSLKTANYPVAAFFTDSGTIKTLQFNNRSCRAPGFNGSAVMKLNISFAVGTLELSQFRRDGGTGCHAYAK